MKLRYVISLASLLVAGFQSSGAPPDLNEKARRIQPATVQIGRFDPDGDPIAEIAWEEADFARRVNNLAAALNDFSQTYNAAGHMIDVKKVRAVRKAWVELEKSGWFRTEEKR
jgi:hypothetical protein